MRHRLLKGYRASWLITSGSYNLFYSSHLRCGYLHQFSNNAPESGDMISMSRHVLTTDMVATMCQRYVCSNPSTHEMLTQYCFDVGPTSKTVSQH